MKHKKLIITILCVVLFLSLVIIQQSCKKENNESGSSESESSSEKIEGISHFYVIEGVRDFYVDLSATKDSIDTSGIKAYRENGEGNAESVFMDDYAVSWGEKGVYSVKYVARDSFKEAKIYIYDNTLPTIIGVKDKTVSTVDEILEGISATDQFGFSLAITYFVENEENGKLVVGKNTVTYKVADLVGNVHAVSVCITLI